MAEKTPEVKTFNLKPIEAQLFLTMQQQYQASVSNLLALLAIERFAYNVSEKTRFRLSDGYRSVEIYDEEAEEAAADEPGDSGLEVKGAK
jgi:hypothetical protein